MPVIEKINIFKNQSSLLNEYEDQQCKQLALTVTQSNELPEVCQKIICGLSALTIGRTLRKCMVSFSHRIKIFVFDL